MGRYSCCCRLAEWCLSRLHLERVARGRDVLACCGDPCTLLTLRYRRQARVHSTTHDDVCTPHHLRPSSRRLYCPQHAVQLVQHSSTAVPLYDGMCQPTRILALRGGTTTISTVPTQEQRTGTVVCNSVCVTCCVF